MFLIHSHASRSLCTNDTVLGTCFSEAGGQFSNYVYGADDPMKMDINSMLMPPMPDVVTVRCMKVSVHVCVCVCVCVRLCVFFDIMSVFLWDVCTS
jgi:hypothetical protein